MLEQDIWKMEEKFWTMGADQARLMTAENSLVVFPEPIGILIGHFLWRELMIAQRWRHVDISNRSFIHKGNLVVVAYEISASRLDQQIDGTLCSSTYMLDDEKWLRIAHHQTPSCALIK